MSKVERNHSAEFEDHFAHPRNVGSLGDADEGVGTATVTVSECGDVMRLQIKVDDQGRIFRAVFKAYGCSAAIAAGSVTTEWLKGRSIAEAQGFRKQYVTEALSLRLDKQHASRLAAGAVREALADLRQKSGLAESTTER